MRDMFMGIIVPGAIIIPIAVAIKKYRVLTKGYRYLFIYLWFTAIANLSAQLMAANYINNMPLIHLDTLVETVLLVLFFKHTLHQKDLTVLINGVLIVFPVLCILNLFFQSIYSFNTYTRSLEAIILTAFCGIYWLSGTESGNNVPGPESTSDAALTWTEVSGNWIVSGIQLYFASAMFLFIFSNFLMFNSAQQTNILLWNMHAGITLVMYLFFAKGFSKCKV